jgi:DNA-binding LacI/PurR family transcriptional regulator
VARRLTQQDIARMAGVSQTTVSLVLNNRADTDVRLAPETRERVLRVIRETGYVADPVARRLADRRNRIMGVFTYEPVFPTETGDFYHPFLVGIEECAEQAGCDLLLFTSATSAGSGRRIFSQDSRIRLADGCILLGRTVDRDDLTRLVAEQIPFVSIGRRDDAGGPVPYVGADYPSAMREVVGRAESTGHRRLAYLGRGEGAESYSDRLRGFMDAAAALGVQGLHLPTGELEDVRRARATAVFVEDPSTGVSLIRAALAQGLTVPGDLSVLDLGGQSRPGHTDVDFSGFRIPRREMGRRAVQLLAEVLESGGTPQELLACEPVTGTTLAPPAKQRKASRRG